MNEPRHGNVAISIVVPLYNEEDSVRPLCDRVRTTMDEIGESYELILVNDGSTDGTGELIDQLADQDRRVIAITFSRNFGQTAAMAAGFDESRGEIVVPMDGDLQNDPGDIGRLIQKLDEGYEVVSGWRKDRKDVGHRVFVSKIANAVISRVSGVRLHDYGCSLKAYRRPVIQGIRLYGEMHRFIPIFAAWQGARVAEIPVTHHPRTAGQSKYGYRRTIKVLLDLIVVKFMDSYLTKPIYVFGGFGIASIVLSFVAFAIAVLFKLIPADSALGPGWHKDFVETPLPFLSIGLFVLGIQMILIGLLAEMVMRTYFESQQKPAYVVKSVRRHQPDAGG